MPTWAVIALVLFALALGAALPAMVQAWRTLRTIDQKVSDLAPEVTALARELRATVARLDAAAQDLTAGPTRPSDVLRSVDEAVRAVTRIEERVAGLTGLQALVPAATAAFAAFRAWRSDQEEAPDDQEQPAPQPPAPPAHAHHHRHAATG